MTLAANKFIQVDGAAADGRQPMKESVFNDELRVWSEYRQTDVQAFSAGVPAKLTCDGVEYSNLVPSGGVVIFDTSTSELNLISGVYYFIQIFLEAAPTSNNTYAEILIVDPASPSTIYYNEVMEFSRSGTTETNSYLFDFFAKITGDAAIYINSDKALNVSDVTVVAKREI